MPPPRQGANRPGPAPGLGPGTLSPAHRAVHVCLGAAGHRRGPRPRPPWSLPPPAATGSPRPGSSCHRRRPPAGRRPRPGQGQRARGPPPPPAGHQADEPGRPRPQLRLVTMATTPPGLRPMAPLPPPAQSRPRHVTVARGKGPSCNEPAVVPAGRELAGPASYPAARGWVTRPASTGVLLRTGRPGQPGGPPPS